jgi:formylglycine-generating enzyme required for sulfatase activity
MQETQVTQEMWESVMGNNPSNFKGSNLLPVESVSWHDCRDYIKELNALEVSPSGYKFSLPPEAQWEYACRAGSTTAYSFGNSWEQLKYYAWYNNNSNKTLPVGQKKANSWGLYDMHGNVWEWCNGQHDDYPTKSVINPVGTPNGSFRVNRGGGWTNDARYCRSANRNDDTPLLRSSCLGVRLSLVSEDTSVKEQHVGVIQNSNNENILKCPICGSVWDGTSCTYCHYGSSVDGWGGGAADAYLIKTVKNIFKFFK